MKKRWITLTFVGFLSLQAPAWSQPRLADPEVRQQLRQQIPDLDQRLWRAFRSLHDKHPGLLPGILSHWLEDLQGEPLQAFLAIHQATLDRYPDLPRRVAGWMEEERRHYPPPITRNPELRKWWLKRPFLTSPQMGQLLLEHRSLLRSCALSLSLMVDEHYPQLPQQIRQRPPEQSVLGVVAEQAPGLLPRALKTLESQHGKELRPLWIQLLRDRERQARVQLPGWRETMSPEMVDELRQFHGARLERWRQRFEQAAPELPQLVHRTLQERHPQLRVRARASLERHYPGLIQEWEQALQRELGRRED